MNFTPIFIHSSAGHFREPILYPCEKSDKLRPCHPRPVQGLALRPQLPPVPPLMSIELILTHPGGAHKDDYLACSLLVAQHGAPIERREPEQGDLDNPAVLVVDVGGEHEPGREPLIITSFSVITPRSERSPWCCRISVSMRTQKWSATGSSPLNGLIPGEQVGRPSGWASIETSSAS